MLNFFTRSFSRRSTIRFSFSDCAPGMKRSMVSSPTTMGRDPSCASGRDRDPLHREDLDGVADLQIVVLVEPDAALEAGLHFADIVLEAAERSNPPFVDDDVVAD